MSQEDKEKLQCEINEKVRSFFSDDEHLLEFFKETLSNFTYRYIETEFCPKVEVSYEEGGDWAHHFIGKSFEKNMVEALKIKNKEAHSGILELAKSVPKKEGPTVQLILAIDISNLEKGHTGKIGVKAQINWDFPNHSFESPKKKEVQEIIRIEDIIQLRNKLPLALEKVCELF